MAELEGVAITQSTCEVRIRHDHETYVRQRETIEEFLISFLAFGHASIEVTSHMLDVLGDQLLDEKKLKGIAEGNTACAQEVHDKLMADWPIPGVEV